MRIHNRFTGAKGLITTRERVIRFRDMITEAAKQRTRILAFWKKHGTEATEEAFGTKRRTLFNWQRNLKVGGGTRDALNRTSTAPKQKRKRLWDVRILEEIKRLRSAEVHPNLGAEKLYHYCWIFVMQTAYLNAPCHQQLKGLHHGGKQQKII